MKALGGLMCVAGLLGAFGFFFLYDTTVPSTTGGRIHNIGLIAERQNGTVFSMGLAIIGVLLIIAAGKREHPAAAQVPPTAALPAPVATAPARRRFNVLNVLIVVTGAAIVTTLAWPSLAPRHAETATPMMDQLDTFTAERRGTFLRELIESEHHPCAEVVRTALQTKTDQYAVWDASCFRGKTYSVTVNQGGSTMVIEHE